MCTLLKARMHALVLVRNRLMASAHLTDLEYRTVRKNLSYGLNSFLI